MTTKTCKNDTAEYAREIAEGLTAVANSITPLDAAPYQRGNVCIKSATEAFIQIGKMIEEGASDIASSLGNINIDLNEYTFDKTTQSISASLCHIGDSVRYVAVANEKLADAVSEIASSIDAFTGVFRQIAVKLLEDKQK